MTDDDLTSLSIRVFEAVVQTAGSDDACAVLWAALVLAHRECNSIDAAVYCIEGGLEELRKELVGTIKLEGSIQ